VASADLNGSPDPANPPNSRSIGGPVAAQPAFGLGSVFPVAPPANNDMSAVGMGGNFSRADAQVGSTALIQPLPGGDIGFTGNLTQAWNVAESYIAADGFSAALSRNSSVTGFDSDFTLKQPAILHFAFEADPYMAVSLSSDAAAGSVNANLEVLFTVTNGAGATVFNWSPDGKADGIFNGVEHLDEENLNGSVEVTSVGASAVYDPTGDNSVGTLVPGATASYSAETAVLPPGVYTLSLDMVENINVTAVEGACLEIEKTPDAADEVIRHPGESASFTIVVTSCGPGTARGVMIDDDLPDGGMGLTWTIDGNPGPDACSIDIQQHLNCGVGDLDDGDTFSVTVETTGGMTLYGVWVEAVQ